MYINNKFSFRNNDRQLHSHFLFNEWLLSTQCHASVENFKVSKISCMANYPSKVHKFNHAKTFERKVQREVCG